jgi:hypothetical protein
MSITQNPAATVKAGVAPAKTYSNTCIVSATTSSLGDIRDVFCGGVLLCSIPSNLGTELQLDAIILEAGSLVPPAKGTVVTVDSVAYMVRESSVAETDAEEAKLSLTLQKFTGTTYVAPAPPP